MNAILVSPVSRSWFVIEAADGWIAQQNCFVTFLRAALLVFPESDPAWGNCASCLTEALAMDTRPYYLSRLYLR